MPEEIESPWCTYGWFMGPWDFGKVTHEDRTSVRILYSEGQHYSPECWESKWVKRFPTLIEAVEDYIKNRSEPDIRERGFTDNEIRGLAREKFPSYYRKLLPLIISNQP